jgi:GTP-binding protein HflX
LSRLLEAVSAAFEEEKTERELRLGFEDGRKRAWLHAEGVVVAEKEMKSGHRLTVRWTARQEKRFREL